MTLYFAFFLSYTLGFPLFLTLFLKSPHNHLKLDTMNIGVFILTVLDEDSDGRTCSYFISSDPS